MQAHPALQLAVKVLIGAVAITVVYQSQLYALWLQYLVAGMASVLVAAYGFSRSSLSSSGTCLVCKECCLVRNGLVTYAERNCHVLHLGYGSEKVCSRFVQPDMYWRNTANTKNTNVEISDSWARLLAHYMLTTRPSIDLADACDDCYIHSAAMSSMF